MGLGEIIVIAALVLIFLGPRRMPEVMRALGRAWVEVRHAKESMLEPLQEELTKAAGKVMPAGAGEELEKFKKEFTDGDS